MPMAFLVPRNVTAAADCTPVAAAFTTLGIGRATRDMDATAIQVTVADTQGGVNPTNQVGDTSTMAAYKPARKSATM